MIRHRWGDTLEAAGAPEVPEIRPSQHRASVWPQQCLGSVSTGEFPDEVSTIST